MDQGIKSSKDDQPDHNYNSIQEATAGIEHIEDADIRIFCNGAMNLDENKLGIRCIVCNGHNIVWQKSLYAFLEILD